MKFSLKTSLIGFAIVGSLIGWMGKLWIENPELFFQMLAIATTVVPFALAVATIIWLGWRGRQRSAGLIAWGLLLLLAPALGGAARHLLLPSGQPIRVLSTPRLVGNRLPLQINEPWIWNELEYRVGQGELSKKDVKQVVQKLIAYMETAKPNGWNQPLAWQKKFIGTVRQQKLISDDVLVNLCEAFFGIRPTLRPIAPVRPGLGTISLAMDYGNPWSNTSNLGVGVVWHVRSVSIDGRPVPLTNSQKFFGRNWSAQCEVNFKPGDHELVIEVEIALVDENKLAGIDVNTTAPDQWPSALKRWKTKVKQSVIVQPDSDAGE